MSNDIEREAFEERNPVPEDAVYNAHRDGYYWVSYPNVNHPFNNDWMTWQEAVAWQAARTSSAGAVPDGWRQTLEQIAHYPRTRDQELSAPAMRQMARDALTVAPTAPAGSPEPVAIVNHWSIAGKSGGSGVSATGIENLPDGTKLYTHPHNGEQVSKWRRALERIARYPRTRSEELSAPGMREMAREALSDLYPHLHEGVHHNGEQGGEWSVCCEKLPKIGQRVILKKNGVIQHYMPVLDQCDTEGLFWDFEDGADYDPLVDMENDEWMPQPPTEREGRGHE